MIHAELFQWVEFNKDVPDNSIKKGYRGVVLDILKPTQKQKEPGYIAEVRSQKSEVRSKTLSVLRFEINNLS